MSARSVGLIARSVVLEAVRRREIYVIVLAACALIGVTMSLEFFELEGLSKFYREIALKVMSVATAVAAIVLASRQFPREFEQRTIYPLLARPIGRTSFALGKLAGVMLAAAFCFALFMLIFWLGSLRIGAPIPWALFLQYIYLQLVMIVVVSTLCFLLSMLFNLDAAISLGVLFLIVSSTYTTMISQLYPFASAFGRGALIALNYTIPQLVLFDLSAKTTHSEAWPPLSAGVMGALTLYGLVFASVYFLLAMALFRRRAL